MKRTRRHVLIAAVTLGTVWLLSAGLRSQMPAQDQGAAGAWQKLLKLQTTASAMHTTAHPDDEHGGVLALLSRGLPITPPARSFSECRSLQFVRA